MESSGPHTEPPPTGNSLATEEVMKTFRLLVAALFAAAALTVSAAAITAAPALAATCGGHGCDHTDPYATGCAGSGASYYVVASTPIYKGSTNVQAGYVQLWYSNTCGTNWARIVVYNDGLNDIYYVKSGVYTADSRQDVYDQYPGTSWTNQLYAPTVKAQACGEILADSFSTSYTCTGWY
jgi:hypothetical protein